MDVLASASALRFAELLVQPITQRFPLPRVAQALLTKSLPARLDASPAQRPAQPVGLRELQLRELQELQEQSSQKLGPLPA
mmetsp:Transcript_16638/g.29126  ORF Transcript_16638/g.29126 Transcript_16638/m.29126 type:complete len:81 (+) Transcript_16638:76-318(+)